MFLPRRAFSTISRHSCSIGTGTMRYSPLASSSIASVHCARMRSLSCSAHMLSIRMIAPLASAPLR